MTAPGLFTLLMAVYAGDRPEFFLRAFVSSVQEQTRRPDEVVLVEDGPLPAALRSAVDRCISASPVPVRVVQLPHNGGLAEAMTAGLRMCSHDVVARMDADDVSQPTRFEQTVCLLEDGLDMVGSGLLEIGEDESVVLGRRDPPTRGTVIAHAARWHDPFNHPSVVYRRSAVEAAGGYQHLPLLEDYWLFARMILNDAKVANVAEPLVLYRICDGAYERRGGLGLLQAEVRLQVAFVRSGFTTPVQFARNITLRGGYRLVPATIRRWVYRLLIASRGARLERSPRVLEAPEPSNNRNRGR